jgi:hypothetical protein
MIIEGPFHKCRTVNKGRVFYHSLKGTPLSLSTKWERMQQNISQIELCNGVTHGGENEERECIVTHN